MTLIEWLREQLDLAEEALNRLDSDFRLYADDHGHIAIPEEKWADGTDRLPNHHNTWSPVLDRQERLAEVKAKRAILDRLESEPHDVNGNDPYYTCPSYTDPAFPESWNPTRDPTDPGCSCYRNERVEAYERLLAQPYAGQNGWQEEWSVTE